MRPEGLSQKHGAWGPGLKDRDPQISATRLAIGLRAIFALGALFTARQRRGSIKSSGAVSLDALCHQRPCTEAPQSGPVAQLGARVNGIHEVTGSIPVWSTILSFTVSISRK